MNNLNRKSVSQLPDDILKFHVALFLSKTEKLRFFGLQTCWKVILYDIRKIRIIGNKKIERFLSETIYRNKVLELLGSQIQSPKKKIRLRSYDRSPILNLHSLPQYSEYIIHAFVSTPSIASDEYMEELQRIRNIWGLSSCATINLSSADLHKLHRLVVNADNKIVNLEDLDDKVYLTKQSYSLLSQEDRNKSLALLKNISQISITADGVCTIDMKYNNHLEFIEGNSIDTSNLILFDRVPGMYLNMCELKNMSLLASCRMLILKNCHTAEGLEALAECESLDLENSCNNMKELPTLIKLKYVKLTDIGIQSANSLSHIRQVHIEACQQVHDLRMLGNVETLILSKCKNIKQYPIPTGKKQKWTFQYLSIVDLHGYGNLERFRLLICNNITDISNLGNVIYLEIIECKSVCYYPTPLGTKNQCQSWSFEKMGISDSDLSGYHCLHFLELLNCDNVSDVCGLANIHTLEVRRCKNISDVSALAHVKLLTLVDCKRVMDVSMLSAVEELRLMGCSNVQSVAGLRNVFGRGVPQHLMSAEAKWYYDI